MNQPNAEISLNALRQIERWCTRFESQWTVGHSGLDELLAEAKASEDLSASDLQTLRDELVALNEELTRLPDAANADAQDADEAAPEGLPRYQFLERIGRGGIGLVWRVHDLETDRTLALKMLRHRYRDDPNARQRLKREALLTGSLQHPNVPPVHEMGSLADGSPYFTLKLVEGRTLDDVLKNYRLANTQRSNSDPFEVASRELLDVFTQVVRTIAYAHTCDVIHRDLKPHNVMIGRFGEVQVIDWGLAKRLNLASRGPGNDSESHEGDPPGQNTLATHPTATQLGDVVGTPQYMSPEQARGEVESVDQRSDVFSLGAIFYEILTKEKLYDGQSSRAAIEQCKRADLTSMLAKLEHTSAPEQLKQLCRRCLEPNHDQRLGDARSIATAMSQYFADVDRWAAQAEAERISSGLVAEEAKKRSRLIAGSSCLLAVLSIMAAAGIGWQWRRAVASEKVAKDAQALAAIDAEAINQVNEYLNSILTSAGPDEDGDDVTLRQVIDDTLPSLEGKFQDRPRVEGLIRRTLGDTYRRLDEYEIANEQLRAALAAYQRARPVDRVEVLLTMDRLAENLHFDGSDESLREAEQLRREILAERIETLGELNESTITAMHGLARILIDQENYAEAETSLQQAIRSAETVNDFPSVESLDMQIRLAYCRANMEQEVAAEAGYRKVLASEDITTAQAITAKAYLGQVLQYQDRTDEAIAALQETIQMSAGFFGEESEATLDAEMKLARVFDDASQVEPLLELLDVTIPKHIAFYGRDGGDIWELRKIKIRRLRKLGRDEEALTVLKTAYRDLDEDRPGHRYTRQAKAMLEQWDS